MAYTTQSEIETKIPANHLVNALDDDGDGNADTGILTAIIESAGNAVDAYLAGLFTVPFTTVPAPCREAAFIFACETIYDRRQILEKNPYKDRADFWRKRLEEIGKGAIPLDAASNRSFVAGEAIVSDAEVDGSMR